MASQDSNHVRLSLCMIVRDNSRTLSACLESIRPWVDEIVVVDTGSHDETPQIASSFGARLFYFPWCDDFSAARNESLIHATGQWLFWMDSDDTISQENGAKLRALADRSTNESPLAYIMQVYCPGPQGVQGEDVTVVDHVKMFRNHPEIRFEGRIHEQVLPAIRRLGGRIEWTDIHVVHSGVEHTLEARRRKQDRDLRILGLELADHPEHTFHLFNLGMTYADMEEHERAVDALRRSLASAESQESHVRKVYALLVGCLTRLEKYQEAREVCDQGLSLFPKDSELNFRCGIVAQQQKRFDDAIQAYRAALRGDEERHFSSMDRGIAGFKARHNLALVLEELDRYDLAEIQWRSAVAEMPSYRLGWRGLGETLIRQRKFTTAEVLSEHLERHPDLNAESILLRLEVAQARGDVAAARNASEEAALNHPFDEYLLRARAQFLFEQGDLVSAESVLNTLTEQCPGDAAAWHNLGLALVHSKRFKRAEEVFRRSLELRPGYKQTEEQLQSITGTISPA